MAVEKASAVIARAAGKIILSGEHAVVYGGPAVVSAVNRFATATVENSGTEEIIFMLPDLGLRKVITLSELYLLMEQLNQQTPTLNRGVLTHPLELIEYTLAFLATKLTLVLDLGIKVRITSNIPMSCGLGSSAAVIVSLLMALAQYFKVTVDLATYAVWGKEIEHLQHGQSSGIDPFISLHRGCYLFENGQTIQQPMTSLPCQIVNSGARDRAAYWCLDRAAAILAQPEVIQAFAKVTRNFIQAWQQSDNHALIKTVKTNHRLLNELGVIPNKVQQFIKEIEQLGGAAKISGAGAVAGEVAGAILVFGVDSVSELIAAYGYEWLKVAMVNTEENVCIK